jgi:diguanylate cyclase (GGDEF)-like protein
MTAFSADQFLILIVDDIHQNLQILGSILDKEAYNTTFATTGQQALDRVKTVKPDLILLDLMMPVMNGLQLCEILRSQEETADIPIIMITASHEAEHLVSAFTNGAVDYLKKPYLHFELLMRVKVHLELKKSREDLKKALLRLERLAMTDDLTGIPNRRYLFEFALKEVARSKRFNYPLSLMIIDIDHFKRVNDRYGHPMGDEVLKAVASNLASSLRGNDFLARFGGEEFIIILADTDINGAEVVAERLRRTIAELTLLVQENCLNITLSLGVGTLGEEEETFDQLLKRCDDALLEAKQSGRNCYRLSRPPSPCNQAS